MCIDSFVWPHLSNPRISLCLRPFTSLNHADVKPEHSLRFFHSWDEWVNPSQICWHFFSLRFFSPIFFPKKFIWPNYFFVQESSPTHNLFDQHISNKKNFDLKFILTNNFFDHNFFVPTFYGLFFQTRLISIVSKPFKL